MFHRANWGFFHCQSFFAHFRSTPLFFSSARLHFGVGLIYQMRESSWGKHDHVLAWCVCYAVSFDTELITQLACWALGNWECWSFTAGFGTPNNVSAVVGKASQHLFICDVGKPKWIKVTTCISTAMRPTKFRVAVPRTCVVMGVFVFHWFII